MKTLLLVDDDPTLCRLLATRFQSVGYRIFAAHDAAHATGMAIKHGPDLILLDISMPAGNGFVVARRLSEAPETASVPVVFMTADESAECRNRAKESGASAFFTKPLDVNRLIDTVSKLLDAEVPSES